MLSDQQRFYEETGAHFIPPPAKYKANAPFLKEVDNQALTQEHNKLSQAFRVFFKNPEAFGHPRFKRKKDDRDSFSACNHKVYPTIWLTDDGNRMTKAGIVKATFPDVRAAAGNSNGSQYIRPRQENISVAFFMSTPCWSQSRSFLFQTRPSD